MSTRCTLFDPIAASVTGEISLHIARVLLLCDTDTWFVAVDDSAIAFRFAKDAKQLPVPSTGERLLDHVEDAQANRHACLFLTRDGRLWSLGKDPLQTGMLGIGSKDFTARSPAMLQADPAVCLSVSDTYAAALTVHSDLLLWGTTREQFFGKVL